MHSSLTRVPLDDLGLLCARGPDARKFLHGQVSQEVLAHPADSVALAGLHNPQGRVLAIVRLVPLPQDGLLLVLPGEIVAAVVQRLRRYVLRARLTLEDVTGAWRAVGLAGPGAAAALDGAGLSCPGPAVGSLASRDGVLAWRHASAPERFIVLAPCEAGLPAALQPQDDATAMAEARRDWRAADIAAGLPQVHAATAEAFVAQMLNLDVLHGISFQKGCYTGQEVIARTHYRGRVKRRLQRFRTLGPAAARLRPGESGTLPDGRGFRVVDAVELADGRVEWLAVAALSAAAGEDEAPAGSAAATGSDAPPQPENFIQAETLPLPYALPD